MSTNQDKDESALIEGLKANDRDVFRLWIKRYQDSVFRICLGFVRNREDAEELTQDVFMEAFKNIDKFRGDCKMSTWLYRISYYRSLNCLRKNKWQGWLKTLDELVSFSQKNKEPAETGHIGPEEELEYNDMKAILDEALNKLTEQQKTAFILCKYEGLSYKEIAEVMQLSESSVESLIYRARQNLQKRLEGIMHL